MFEKDNSISSISVLSSGPLPGGFFFSDYQGMIVDIVDIVDIV
jgi:hypothetical protein